MTAFVAWFFGFAVGIWTGFWLERQL